MRKFRLKTFKLFLFIESRYSDISVRLVKFWWLLNLWREIDALQTWQCAWKRSIYFPSRKTVGGFNHRYRLHWVTEMSINTSFGTHGSSIERRWLNVQSDSALIWRGWVELLPWTIYLVHEERELFRIWNFIEKSSRQVWKSGKRLLNLTRVVKLSTRKVVCKFRLLFNNSLFLLWANGNGKCM